MAHRGSHLALLLGMAMVALLVQGMHAALCAPSGTKRWVTATALNVRSAPSTSASILGKLPYGCEVRVSRTGPGRRVAVPDPWVYCRSAHPSISGWCHGDYLSTSDPYAKIRKKLNSVYETLDDFLSHEEHCTDWWIKPSFEGPKLMVTVADGWSLMPEEWKCEWLERIGDFFRIAAEARGLARGTIDHKALVYVFDKRHGKIAYWSQYTILLFWPYKRTIFLDRPY